MFIKISLKCAAIAYLWILGWIWSYDFEPSLSVESFSFPNNHFLHMLDLFLQQNCSSLLLHAFWTSDAFHYSRICCFWVWITLINCLPVTHFLAALWTFLVKGDSSMVSSANHCHLLICHHCRLQRKYSTKENTSMNQTKRCTLF